MIPAMDTGKVSSNPLTCTSGILPILAIEDHTKAAGTIRSADPASRAAGYHISSCRENVQMSNRQCLTLTLLTNLSMGLWRLKYTAKWCHLVVKHRSYILITELVSGELK